MIDEIATAAARGTVHTLREVSGRAVAEDRCPVSSFAPANLVVRVHVTPDPANRALEMIAESSDRLRSSRMQLDGEDAPKTIAMEVTDRSGRATQVTLLHKLRKGSRR